MLAKTRSGSCQLGQHLVAFAGLANAHTHTPPGMLVGASMLTILELTESLIEHRRQASDALETREHERCLAKVNELCV